MEPEVNPLAPSAASQPETGLPQPEATPPTAAPVAAMTPEQALAADPTAVWGMKQALERRRIREAAPSSLILQPRVQNSDAIRWVTVPYTPRTTDEAQHLEKIGVPFSMSPMGFQIRGPWYEGEPEEKAVERTRRIVEGKFDIAGKEFWTSFLSTPSFGLSRMLTRETDQEAYRTLGPEWYEKVARRGSFAGMFLPTKLNPPALLFGALAKPLRGLAGRALDRFFGAEAFSGGFQTGLGEAVGVHTVNPQAGFVAWMGRTFGRDFGTKVSPELMNRATAALRAAGGRVTETGAIFIPPTADKAAADAAKAAFAAVRDAMGSTLKLRVYNTLPTLAGEAGAGAGVGAAFGVGNTVAAPSGQRGEAARQIPEAIGYGALFPLAVRGALAGGSAIAGELAGVARGTSPSVRGFGEAPPPPGAVYPNAFRDLLGPPPRLLGAPGDLIVPGARPPAASSGPKAPPISPSYGTIPVPIVPGWGTSQNATLKSVFAEATETLRAQEDLIEADRVAKGLHAASNMGDMLTSASGIVAPGPMGEAVFVGWQDMSTAKTKRPPIGLWNIPSPSGLPTTVSTASILQQGYMPPPLMPLPEEVGAAQTALASGIRDLASRDHTAIGQMLGTNHLPIVFGGGAGMQPRDIPRYVHTARWAAGILEEAQRRGTTGELEKALRLLPPPPPGIDGQADPLAMGARLKGLADIVAAGAPDARVGPPPELGLENDLTGTQPVEITPSRAAPARVSPEEAEGNIRAHAPTPEAWALGPKVAARRQQSLVHTLTGGIPFAVGRLRASRPEALGPADYPEVELTADGEGRIFGTLQNPHALDSQSLVDVTEGLRPLALPVEARWDFIPDRLAPVAFQLDSKTEALVLDADETDARRWIRDSVRTASARDLGARGASDPFAFFETMERTPVTEENAASLRDLAERQIEAHKARVPSPAQADTLAGPDAQPWERDRQHAEMLADHFAIGSALEASRAEVVRASKDEPLEPSYMKVEGEGGEIKAVAGMDPRILEVLGGNLYSGDLGKIAVKEMVQNANDSLMALPDPSKGLLRVRYDVPNRTIEVADDGVGMSTETALSALVDIGGSYKPGTESAGGYGIAKVAIFSNAESILIETSDGKTLTTLRGNASDWLDPKRGLTVTAGPLPPEGSLQEQDNGLHGRTGTRVVIQLKPSVEMSNYSGDGWLRNFLRHERLPYQKRIETAGYNELELVRDQRIPLDEIGKISTPGADYTFYGGKTYQEVSYVGVQVLNKGLPQFNASVFAGDAVKLPQYIAVDIRAKAGPEEANYPFRPDREGLREEARKAVEDYVRGTLAKAAAEKKRNEFITAWTSAPTLTTRRGVPKGRVVNTEGVLKPADLQNFADTREAADLHTTLALTHRALMMLLTPLDPRYARGQYAGFGLGRGYLGVNLDRKYVEPEGAKEQGDTVTLINPFVILDEVIAAKNKGTVVEGDVHAALAYRFLATLIHEIAHQVERGHDESFAGVLTRISEVAFEPDLSRAADDLTEMFAVNNGALYDFLVGWREVFYAGLEAPGDDLFGKVGATSSGGGERPGPEGDTSGGAEPGPEPGSAVPERVFDPARVMAASAAGRASAADTRAAALAHAATLAGWSKKAPLFAALTDDERFASLLARLKGGRIHHPAQLARMNPAKWMTSPPKYFGGWKPSAAQQAALVEAYARRVKLEGERDRVKREIKIRRATPSRFKGPTAKPAWTKLPLAEIVKLDPLELTEWLTSDPETFHATMRHVWPSLDGAFEDASALASGESEAALTKLDALKDVMRALTQDVSALPPPPPTPRDPLSGINRTYQNARSSAAAIRTQLALLQRPAGAVGPRKQTAGFHPGEIRRLVESGEWDRGLFQAGFTGALKRDQATTQAYQEFDVLQQSAAKNPALDKAIVTALEYSLDEVVGELDRPEHTFRTTVRGRTVVTKLSEWVPRLRKFYDRIITEAEKEESYRIGLEKAQFHSDTLWIERALRERQLAAAREAFPDDPLPAWSDIPEEYLAAVHEALLEENALGDSAAEAESGWLNRRDADGIVRYAPHDFSAYSYKSLRTLHRQSEREYLKRKAALRAIENGALRQKGYVTRVHNLTRRDIAHDLRHNPYSLAARFSHPKLRARFLEERTSELPTDSWLEGWMLYLPVMFRKIHLEPALLRMNAKLPELDAFQRSYVEHWMGSLKGNEPPLQVILNRAAYEAGLHQPMALDYAIQAITGHRPDELTKAAKESGDISPRVWSNAMHNATGLLYLTLIGPLKIGLLSMTEFSFLARALSVHPGDLARSGISGPVAATQAAAGGLGEVLSWARQFVSPESQRSYSQPSQAGVTDFLHELEHDLEKYRPGTFLGKVAAAWGPINKSVEFMLRATTYYVMLDRVRRHYPDAEPEFQSRMAALATNDNIGTFGRRDISPFTTGPVGRAYFPLRRFTQTHIESLATTAQGANESVRRTLAGTGLSRLQNAPWLPADPNAGGGEPPPPPPDVPGSAHETWDPGERENWDTLNQPVAKFGTSYPAGPTASRKLLWQAMLGLPLSSFLLWYVGTLLLGDDEMSDDQLFTQLLPYNLQALNEIPILYWYPETWTTLKLGVKRQLQGLNQRESQQLLRAQQELLWDIPLVGRQLRQRSHEVRARREALRRKPSFRLPDVSEGFSASDLRAMKDRKGLVQRIWSKLPPEVRAGLQASGPRNVRKKIDVAAWGMLPQAAQSGLTGVDRALDRAAEALD